MGGTDRRPSGIAQDQTFRRFRKGQFDVDRMLAEQHDNARDGQRGLLVAMAVVVALAIVLLIAGSSGGAAFMGMVAVPLAMAWGVLALVRRFT